MRTYDVIDRKNLLVGEGPLWDDRNQCLYYIDFLDRTIRRVDWNTKEVTQIDLDFDPGCLGLTDGDDLIVSAADHIRLLHPDGSSERISKPAEIYGLRFNDGKVGPDGRFYVGTKCAPGETTAAFYRMDTDGTLTVMFDGVSLSNGLAWNAAGDTMYYCDTPTLLLEAFDFDKETGTLSNRRTVMRIPLEQGRFDGMTIDAEDNLWIAVWGGSCALHIDPRKGDVIEKATLPVTKVACCGVAGEKLDEMVITTAAYQIDLTEEPEAGFTYVTPLAVPGVKADRFGIAR